MSSKEIPHSLLAFSAKVICNWGCSPETEFKYIFLYDLGDYI